ncbi:endonuclease domain-containing 1 protein-like isoform X1 [Salvelinus fontinalis]|uniref:endonuclease domain-containing 1 protein-like isoform X1 n=2 Tax=Salvelinus fontinalis TaxID=8038 RepID=UPI002485A2D1|nr:endonuclease domain-containing 1 protein-like isoform X1 [Salvelinus fontinalis]
MMGILNHLSTLLLLSLLPPALSHVVKKFSDVPQCKSFFLKGTTPNLPGILVDGKVQDQNRYKPICQLFKYKKKTEVKNIYRFATLYDTTNRIPVFSAYTFTGPPTDRRPNQRWMIEPQLEDKHYTRDMMVAGRRLRVEHQATNADYKVKIKGMHLDRGHLFPCSYADDDTMRSTFTLTNAVPQERGFNRGRWSKIECKVREYLVKNCKEAEDQIKAYVVTGAVPSNNKLNKRVNIPDLLWTAYCCKNNLGQWVAGAYWGKNVKGETVNSNTLGVLEKELTSFYKDFKVFPYYCPRKAIQSVEQDETGRNRERVLEGGAGQKRSGKGSRERSMKMARRTRDELKECDEEDGCDCDCDEK